MQTLSLQQDGCDRRNIFIDHGRSGTHADRPQLIRCVNRLQRGDMLVVWKLDRLGRNTAHMLQIVEDLNRRGVDLRCLTQNIDTSTPMGKVIFTVFSAVAEYEHTLIVERTSEGRKLAQKRIAEGDPSAKPFGRKPSLDANKKRFIVRSYKAGTASIGELAKDKGRVQSHYLPRSPRSSARKIPTISKEQTRGIEERAACTAGRSIHTA